MNEAYALKDAKLDSNTPNCIEALSEENTVYYCKAVDK